MGYVQPVHELTGDVTTFDLSGCSCALLAFTQLHIQRSKGKVILEEANLKTIITF